MPLWILPRRQKVENATILLASMAYILIVPG